MFSDSTCAPRLQVAHLYRDSTIGHAISIVLVRVVILEEVNEVRFRSQLLFSFWVPLFLHEAPYDIVKLSS